MLSLSAVWRNGRALFARPAVPGPLLDYHRWKARGNFAGILTLIALTASLTALFLYEVKVAAVCGCYAALLAGIALGMELKAADAWEQFRERTRSFREEEGASLYPEADES